MANNLFSLIRTPIGMEPGSYQSVVLVSSAYTSDAIEEACHFLDDALKQDCSDKLGLCFQNGIPKPERDQLYQKLSQTCAKSDKEIDLELKTFSTEQEALSKLNPARWVHFQENAGKILDGQFKEVTPVHSEITPARHCNLRCPHCTYKKAKSIVSHVSTAERTMSANRMRGVLKKLAVDYGVKSVIFGGCGEPTLNPYLVEGAACARQLGLAGGVYTNGTNPYSETQVQKLMDSLSFFRISLNAVTANAFAKFHGVPPGEAKLNCQRVREHVALWTKLNHQRGGSFNFSLSTIVNSRSLNELETIAEFVQSLGPGIQNMIFKPQINMAEPLRQQPKKVLQEAVEIIEERLRPRLQSVGITVVVNPTKFEHLHVKRNYDYCRGVFWYVSPVDPDGNMYFCTEKSGDADFIIGNLFQQSLPEIWFGERRQELLKWLPDENVCPPTCKEHELNDILAKIDAALPDKRTEIEEWISDLQHASQQSPFL